MLLKKKAVVKRILGFIITIICFSLLIELGCDKKNTLSFKAGENHPPKINNVTAKPSRLAYGGISLLTVEATDEDNDSLIYRWNCNAGSFSGTTTSDSAEWVAPNQVGTYRCDVIVNDGMDSTMSGVDVEVMGLFFDEFSTDLNVWTKNYCDAWLSSEEAHLKGSSSGFYGTLYHYFVSYITPQYTVQMKLARIDNFPSENDIYGLYTKINDTGSVTVKYFWFLIEPSVSGENWRIICFVASYYEGSWATLDEGSFGNSPLIKTGANEWNDISWTVEQDKTIIIKVGDQTLYQSDEISQIESELSLTITMDLVRAGCRTMYYKEVKIDDALVATPSATVFSISKGERLAKDSNDSFEHNITIPILPQDRSELPTLKDVLKNLTIL